jgi:hypothetical protein
MARANTWDHDPRSAPLSKVCQIGAATNIVVVEGVSPVSYASKARQKMTTHSLKGIWVLLTVVGMLWAHGWAVAGSAPYESSQDTSVEGHSRAHHAPADAPQSRQSALVVAQGRSKTACSCPVKQCPNENAPACQASCEMPQTATCTCGATCDTDSGYVKGVNSCTCQ